MNTPGQFTIGELQELLAGHLARFPGSALSTYDFARVLGLPKSNGSVRGRVWKALEALEGQGRAVRVIGPQDEQGTGGRLVTRWTTACGATDGLGLDPEDPEPFGRCNLPAGHDGDWHREMRDGKMWAEWRGPHPGQRCNVCSRDGGEH